MGRAVTRGAYLYKVKLSKLHNAGLDFDTNSADAKYLLNYFLVGQKIDSKPKDWNGTLQRIRDVLGWKEDQSFANITAQVNNIMLKCG